jgi:hypothetical protein
MDSKETRQAEVEKPPAHFDDPHHVVADSNLSKQEKVEALEALEQDARLLSTATEEGMTGGEHSKLSDLLNAKRALEEPSDAANNPPPGSDAEVAKEVESEKLDP